MYDMSEHPLSARLRDEHIRINLKRDRLDREAAYLAWLGDILDAWTPAEVDAWVEMPARIYHAPTEAWEWAVYTRAPTPVRVCWDETDRSAWCRRLVRGWQAKAKR